LQEPVPSAACTNANLFCTGDPTVDGAGCPVGVNVIGNVVGYAPVNANAQYLTANYWRPRYRWPEHAATQADQ